MKMSKNKPSFDRSLAWHEAIYPIRRAAWPRHEAFAQHGRRDAPLPLTRIFHPYEFWAYATPDNSGEDVHVLPRREPDPPKSAWPAAPPAFLVDWVCRWTARGRFGFGAS
jgi:hypothetical protein